MTTPPPKDRQATWVLAMVIATTALTGLSMSIMVVTFPAIRTEFPDASTAQLSWINSLFTIVSAATLIPAGVPRRFSRRYRSHQPAAPARARGNRTAQTQPRRQQRRDDREICERTRNGCAR